MRPRHVAIAASLAFALVGTPVAVNMASTGSAYAAPADSASSGAVEYDKADFYEESTAAAATRSAAATRASNLSPVDVSAEMKYFTKYESHANYRQGFSYGDGYNALGYYQFDRRYSLISFMTAVYNYNPSKYVMFKDVIARGSEVSNGSVSMYDAKAGKLTSLGQMVQDAWCAAYDADPAEFSALQDSYAYNSYYLPTERWLASKGIDISRRADCVKGMVWGLSNMWGTGGVRALLLGANLSNDMTDREFVTALSQQMTDHIEKYSSQKEYYAGWKNRYRSELADCLTYIAEDEAAAAEEPEPAPEPTPETPMEPEEPETGADVEGSDEDGATDEPVADGDAPGDAADEPTPGDGSGEETGGSIEPAGDEESESGDADGGASDEVSDGSSDASGSDSDDVTVPSRPNHVPPANTVTGGSTAGTTDDAASGDASADDDAANANDEGGDTAAGESTSTSDEHGDDSTKTDAKQDGKEEAGEKSDSKTSDAQKKPGQSKKTDGDSSKSTEGDGDAADVHPNGVMPQTSDLIILTTCASASTACFGATFVYAGKRRLKKHADERDEQDA